MVLVHVGYLVLPVFGSVRNRGTVLIFISIQNMCPVYLNMHCSCGLASSSLAVGLACVRKKRPNFPPIVILLKLVLIGVDII